MCVCGNNEIEKAYGEVNTKKISLVSNLINAFPKGLSEAILYKALPVRIKKLQKRFWVRESFLLDIAMYNDYWVEQYEWAQGKENKSIRLNMMGIRENFSQTQ